MKKVQVIESGAECQLVSSYEDLKSRNVVDIVRTVYLNPADMKMKVKVLEQLFDAPAEVWRLLRMKENEDQLWRLTETLSWIWKGPSHRPVEKLRIAGAVYMLPDDQLYQLSTAEFIIATAHLIGFHTSKNDAEAMDGLHKFLATIIRPKPTALQRLRSDPSGDPRQAFNSIVCEKRARNFEKVDIVTKVLIAQWFNNAANRMLATAGLNAKSGEDAAPITQGIFVQDWERQVVKVAEGGVYGNFDMVMQRAVMDVLSYIDFKNDEIRKDIEARKQNNRER